MCLPTDPVSVKRDRTSTSLLKKNKAITSLRQNVILVGGGGGGYKDRLLLPFAASFHANNINRDNGIEIPEKCMPNAWSRNTERDR